MSDPPYPDPLAPEIEAAQTALREGLGRARELVDETRRNLQHAGGLSDGLPTADGAGPRG